MSKRKDHLKALFGGSGEGDAPSPSPTPAPQAPETKSAPVPTKTEAPRSSSGAVKAMGLSLSSMSREVEDARAIRESLAKGERIVEIDPDLIDPSLVRDRLSREDDGDEDFNALVESMRENGQQVPVLLRPHPTKNDRFQVAYGHRRVRAAGRLKRPVQAIVRTLNDDELVLAQGKENTERRNLSFIERAFFADGLMRHGFDRGVVQRSLSLHKAEMTRLLQVAEAVPVHIASAIGPAPKAGRPRWMALAEFLKREAAVVIAQDEITSVAFRAADSDERFRRLYERLARRAATKARKADKVRAVADSKGRPLAKITLGATPRLDFDEKTRPGFADYVATLLPEL
uniref:plasmid partitioning protein RepB n=1 Tax=uncultured Nitratireductor sp. TaxID=520953 RepID=UPI0025FFF6A3